MPCLQLRCFYCFGGTKTSYLDRFFLYGATSLHSSRLLSTSGYTTYQVYVHCIILNGICMLQGTLFNDRMDSDQLARIHAGLVALEEGFVLQNPTTSSSLQRAPAM